MTISPTMMVIRSANIATAKQSRMGVPFGALLEPLTTVALASRS
jgi:hypothetical protein